MWQHHLTIVGVLIALALPIWLLDHFLLKPSGDIFLINVRGIMISAYLAWLAVHVPLSSAGLYLFNTERLYILHGIGALLSVGLLVGGMMAHDRIEAAQWRKAREARMEMRETLADSITLEKWWYVPGAGRPDAIGAVFIIRHSGRLAASVRGEGRGDVTVFSGEMKPQRQVAAGDRIEHVFPLVHYGEDASPRVRFTFRLFRDRHGSAPEDIMKEYGDYPARTDDGEYFRDVLPPPTHPQSSTPRESPSLQ